MLVQIRSGHRVSAQILFSRHDAVGLITLNRPDVLNAFAEGMREELVDAVREAAEDTAIRAIVMTGAGRGFCAGADVRRMHELVSSEAWDELEAFVEVGATIVRTIDDLRKPVLAAVNGAAAGGGANLALACDIRIAATSASIGQTFNRVGLQPDWGGTYFLPRIVGLGHALELVLTAEMLSSADALRLGIFNRVVDDGRVVDETMALAARIAEKSPLAVALAKRSIRQSYSGSLDDAHHTERVHPRRLTKTA